jgi:hypothetical protein
MTLDRELVKEACIELWDECHERIEELGYTLSKDSMLQGPEGISIIATIRPGYSPDMVDAFRKIIPMEKNYRGEDIPVIISPSVSYLFGS